MSIQVNHTVTATLNGGTLSELKELVTAAEQAGFSGSSRVIVEHHRGTDQRDPSYTTITVRQR